MGTKPQNDSPPRRLMRSVFPKTPGRDTVPWTDTEYPEDDDDDTE